ncbi:MAG TPA: hypothetical protein VFP17_11440 [Solirubrobacterales bacterium]|nr:hypothetical protein [Solirubrobacterales bacterium]
MPALLKREEFAGLGTGIDERRARLELRRQIGRLEAELAGLFGEAFGHTEVAHRVDAVASGPRLLDLGELEAIRDRLAERIGEARQALVERRQVEDENRALVERMLAAPQDFKWVRVSRQDLGLPGCGHWHSRPRLGPLGMLMGWWRVKVSSGCPLARRLAAVDDEVEAREEEAGRGEAGEAGRAETRQAGLCS